MAINLGTLYNRLFNLVNKDQSGQSYTPDQMNNDLQYVQYKYLKLKYGLPEQPMSAQAYEVSQKITDDVKELKVWMGGPDNAVMNVDSKGRAPIPSDYWHVISCFYYRPKQNCETQEFNAESVDMVTEDQRVMRLSCPLTKPTFKNPIACLYSNYVQFYPTGIQQVHFTYLRRPATPVFDYDIINDEPVYVPPGQLKADGTRSRSVELELPEDTYEDIVNIMLADQGLRTKDQWPYQAGEQRKTTGF